MSNNTSYATATLRELISSAGPPQTRQVRRRLERELGRIAVAREPELIAQAVHWFSLVGTRVTREISRECMIEYVKKLLRSGTMAAVKIIKWANEGEAIADQALREVAAEMWDAHEQLPHSIESYVYTTALHKDRASPSHGQGRDEAGDWLRNMVIACVVGEARERWYPHLKLTRQSARQSSVCRIIAQAATRHGLGNLNERRVYNIYKDHVDFMPLHNAALGMRKADWEAFQ